MRVVHFVEGFSPLSETFIYNQIVELEQQGVDNFVVTLNRINKLDRPFPKVKVINLPPKWHPERVFSRIVIEIGLVKEDEQYWNMIRNRLADILKLLKPNVIHAHFGTSGVLVAPVVAELSCPLIVTFHGYDAFQLTKQQQWIERYADLFKQASLVLVVADFMKRYLVESCGASDEHTLVLHPGKQISEYPYRMPKHPIRHWISVGSLREKKGHFDCIQAFALSAANKNDFSLHIIGDGPLESELLHFINQLGITDKVHLLGGRSHNEVIQYLYNADAFILCSKAARNGDMEGAPSVLLEAQAIGLPCISTKHSGIPEVIPEDNHWALANEGDVSGIAHCMHELTNMSQERLESASILGRNKVEIEFDIGRNATTLVNIYNNLSK